jgi:hypothetical protein
MKLCVVLPVRSAATAMRTFKSSGKRIVVVDIMTSLHSTKVAQLCYRRECQAKANTGNGEALLSSSGNNDLK